MGVLGYQPFAVVQNDVVAIHGGFSLDEASFLETIQTKIEDFAKQSVILKIKSEWIRLSGTSTPAEWAMSNKIPARYIFGGASNADDLLKAIEHPDNFAASRLTDLLETLTSLSGTSIADCQNALITDAIPKKYEKFGIGLAPLLEFLCNSYGEQPNNWPLRLDVSEFIKSQYKGTIGPQVKQRINNKSAEDLKQKLLKLADENPELGLMFLED